jgi:hypothetical protein
MLPSQILSTSSLTVSIRFPKNAGVDSNEQERCSQHLSCCHCHAPHNQHQILPNIYINDTLIKSGTLVSQQQQQQQRPDSLDDVSRLSIVNSTATVGSNKTLDYDEDTSTIMSIKVPIFYLAPSSISMEKIELRNNSLKNCQLEPKILCLKDQVTQTEANGHSLISEVLEGNDYYSVVAETPKQTCTNRKCKQLKMNCEGSTSSQAANMGDILKSKDEKAGKSGKSDKKKKVDGSAALQSTYCAHKWLCQERTPSQRSSCPRRKKNENLAYGRFVEVDPNHLCDNSSRCPNQNRKKKSSKTLTRRFGFVIRGFTKKK